MLQNKSAIRRAITTLNKNRLIRQSSVYEGTSIITFTAPVELTFPKPRIRKIYISQKRKKNGL